jgi:two-component system, LytTR family, response regulator LytT
MRVVIIEDEKLAAERLQFMLSGYDNSIEVVKHLYGVEEAVKWLKTNAHPDLLFLDIQLADGFCFEIFKQIDYSKPVIFTTAYNQYALDAFQLLSVDYLLKPVSAESLARAMNKFMELSKIGTTVNYQNMQQVFETSAYKSRLLAKVGQKMFFIETSKIEYFKADDKLVYLSDTDGNRLLIDYTLEKLETLLNPKEFFRLNRQVIARYTSIAQIKPYVNSRLKLLLRCGTKTEEVILSRDRVHEFKTWAEV